MVTRSGTVWLAMLGIAIPLSLTACQRTPPVVARQSAPVKAMIVRAESKQLYVDKVGEVGGSQEVMLRARVSGVLMKQTFVDGALVKENQPLFTIDAREYRAQLANAQAQLAAAQASLTRAEQDVGRYEPLVAENAVSRQVYESAVATAREARAQVEATRAAIDEAKLGVEYATVRAPFTGRIGAAKVFEGALITAGTTELVTLYRDDPAWVNFSVSETELLDYQRRFGPGRPTPDAPLRQVRLLLSDGSMYAMPGHINFIANALDPATGTFALRAEFPNPDHRLLPGLFARVRVSAEHREKAMIVPDRAVQQQLGRYFVVVVGADNKAEMRAIEPGPRFGDQWIVNTGLKPGDRVIVEGMQKARPGSPVKVTLVTAGDLRPRA